MKRMTRQELILNAASRALKTSYFHRSGGAAKQAGIELKDYRPKDRVEIFEYYGNIIDLLLSADEPVKELAQEILIEKFNQQYSEGNHKKAYEALQEIIRRNGFTQELREQLSQLISSASRLNPDKRTQLEEVLKQHQPKNMMEQLQVKVIRAPFEHVKTEEGYKNISEERAKTFAQELVQNKNNEWVEHLSLLQKGEQRQTFTFAYELGKLTDNKQKIVDKVLNDLAEHEYKSQDDSFLRGFLAGIDDVDFTRSVIDRMIENKSIRHHSFRLSQTFPINQSDLDKLVKLCNLDNELVENFRYLNYHDLNSSEIIKFIEWLSSKNMLGAWLAIRIIESLIEQKKESFKNYKGLITELVTKSGITISDKAGPSSFYHYEVLTKKLLDDGLENEYVIKIVDEIFLACSQYTMVSENYLSTIFYHVLDKYWNISWPKIGPAILDISTEGWYGLKTLLEGYNGFSGDKIIDWIEKNTQEAAVIAMMFIPYGGSEIGEWNPVILTLLEKYGSNETMLNELSGRLHSYTAIGSAIPIFESRKNLLEKLLDHQNPKVKEFAKREIEQFNKSIERENIWSQNHELGEF